MAFNHRDFSYYSDKGEYYFTYKAWKYFLLIGLFFMILSILSENYVFSRIWGFGIYIPFQYERMKRTKSKKWLVSKKSKKKITVL